jgi:SAM-dependent methyltransferase
MTSTNDWQTFFDNHAGRYMDEPFVTGTLGEVDFLIEQLGLTPEMRILDMGCGTGRHAVELARRGYTVTGVDLSQGMLAEARMAAEQAGVTTVSFVQADATLYTTDRPFDRAYCVCEGSLGLIGTGQDPHTHDRAVLTGLYNALKPDGRMLITVLNAMRHIRAFSDEDVAAGRYEPLTATEVNTMETDGRGEKITVTVRERAYVPPELRLLLEVVGFDVAHIGGGTAGDWGIRPVLLDEYELLAIASRPA